MISVSFEINGRRVNPSQVGDAIEKAILKGIEETVAKKLNAVVCRQHGNRPSVICKGKSAQSLKFEISGCCQSLIDAAKSKLS